ncbi:iron chaperone [Proteiniclasticum sp. C24MP]|uniref:iron chaperone n=1 Tax=Proteiniclasticum sp. C24MP TaxID=3374101 RepID=UPI003753EAC8
MNEVEKYIENFPEEVQQRLTKMREIIKELAPEASERICMGIPTYDLHGKWLVHFAGFRKHIGFYPQPEGITAFKEKLTQYKTSKGTIQFPLNKPLPEELIREIVNYRVEHQNG